MLVNEWNQELYFILIVGILISKFSREELFLHTSLLPKRDDRQNETKKTSNR